MPATHAATASALLCGAVGSREVLDARSGACTAAGTATGAGGGAVQVAAHG